MSAVSITLSVSAAPAPEPQAPEPGTEPNLHLLDCPRCGEPMYHYFRLEAEYPLCLWWAFKCGECGRRVDAWEDKPVPWHTARYEDGYEVPE